MNQEQFEREYPIAAKVFEKYKGLLEDSHNYIRQMLAELEFECDTQYHETSLVKELEAPNDYYQQPKPKYTATQLAAKLAELGYKGRLSRETPFYNTTESDSKQIGLYTEILDIEA